MTKRQQTALLTAARALLDWGRDNTRPSDPDSPHNLLIALDVALADIDGRIVIPSLPVTRRTTTL